MRLVIQILRKDAERLWPAIALALSLLVYWIFTEATYSVGVDVIPATQGNWLNLALPFPLALLVALCVNEDALVGDRQFWVTLPCGWRPLLAAKAMFIAAFVQLPYFIATAVILAARGFNPLAHLPHLFWKQVVLLAVVLPAFAAAALVKNLGQFLLLSITVASAFTLLSNSANMTIDMSWDVRGQLALLLLCAGAAPVIVLQFQSRRMIRSAAIGMAAVLAALGSYTWMSRETSASLSSALTPVRGVSLTVRIDSNEPDNGIHRRWYNSRRTSVLIPLVFDGIPANVQARFEQIGLELITANGEHYAAHWPDSPDSSKRLALSARFEAGWQALEFYDPAVWNRLRSGNVRIHGHILVRLERPGTASLVSGVHGELSDGEFCSVVSIGSDAADTSTTRVTCESPERPARETGVFWTTGHASGGGILREHVYFGDSFFPLDPWLSPLHRGTYTFGGRNVVLRIAPRIQLGSTLIEYSLLNIDLNRFLVRAPGKMEAGK